METFDQVVVPLTAFTLAVPDSVPPPGLVPMATVIEAVARSEERRVGKDWRLPGGVNDAKAEVLLGCTPKASWLAAPTVMLKLLLVAPVSPLEAAVSV